MTPETIVRAEQHVIDHRHPTWSAIVAKAISSIRFIEEEENNLRCARDMQVGRHYARFELPEEPSAEDPTLEVSIELLHKPEAPHIDEPSIVLQWETPGVDEMPQREHVAVAVARVIGDQIELQNTFDRPDYDIVGRTLAQIG